MTSSTYLTLLAMGSAGGIRCAAMCGGFAATATFAGCQPAAFLRNPSRLALVSAEHAGTLTMHGSLRA
jgi:sulfite exporter TauE/SafE